MTQLRPVRLLRMIVLAALMASPATVGARDVLGVFQRWGAFRDAQPNRCFAMAQPLAGGWEASPWRPFAAIGYWPRDGVRGQVNLRLSHQLAAGTRATLSVGNQHFIMAGGEADVWAADQRADAAIIAAMRAGGTMIVGGQAKAGGRFSDRYDLRGAATAVDAAALGCARNR